MEVVESFDQQVRGEVGEELGYGLQALGSREPGNTAVQEVWRTGSEDASSSLILLNTTTSSSSIRPPSKTAS